MAPGAQQNKMNSSFCGTTLQILPPPNPQPYFLWLNVPTSLTWPTLQCLFHHGGPPLDTVEVVASFATMGLPELIRLEQQWRAAWGRLDSPSLPAPFPKKVEQSRRGVEREKQKQQPGEKQDQRDGVRDRKTETERAGNRQRPGCRTGREANPSP